MHGKVFGPLALAAPVAALTCGALAAQDPPTVSPDSQQQAPPVTVVAPVFVTATRTADDPLEIPFATTAVDASRMRERGDRTVPQALREIPGILVQETAHGHGSPYIRGVTSFRNVMLVDGIRLNNSVFRPGPNQYWNTVDSWSLDRLEVVKGPASVLYGSDAIGGTVQAFTRDPDLLDSTTSFFGDRLDVAGSIRGRYATAEDSVQVRGELSMGWAREGEHPTSLLLGGTAKSFGDVEGGAGVGTQPETGYDETDLDAKVVHWLAENTKLVFMHQRVAQNDVPRTHRTVDAIDWRGLSQGSDLRRSFDQNRQLTYVQLHAEELGGAVDTIRANLSLHRQTEVRERVRGNGNREFQGFDVSTTSLWTQLESDSPIGRLTYGASWSHDDVDSFLRRVDAPQAADAIQGPVADDATYDLVDVYVQDAIEVSPRLQFLLGTRFSYARADADSVRDPVSNTRIAIKDDWSSFVSSGRFVWNPWGASDSESTNSNRAQGLRVYGGVSQGFRAPNLSDLTRFDDARSDEFEIPAVGLSPEDYISYEIGAKWRHASTSAEITYFYTDIDDQILRFPTGSINAAGEREITKANIGQGAIEGIEAVASLGFGAGITGFGNLTWMEGRVTNFENATSTPQETWITRLMPVTGLVGLRYDHEEGSFWAESVVRAAGTADKLSFGDLRDTSRIPPGGTPSYAVWDLRMGCAVGVGTQIDLALENVTDVDYRVHGSGLNMPGFQFIFGMTTRF